MDLPLFVVTTVAETVETTQHTFTSIFTTETTMGFYGGRFCRPWEQRFVIAYIEQMCVGSFVSQMHS